MGNRSRSSIHLRLPYPRCSMVVLLYLPLPETLQYLTLRFAVGDDLD